MHTKYGLINIGLKYSESWKCASYTDPHYTCATWHARRFGFYRLNGRDNRKPISPNTRKVKEHRKAATIEAAATTTMCIERTCL